MSTGWKCIKFYFWGQKNQSFWNKSDEAQPIWIKFGIHTQVKEWQRSGNFGRDRPILGKMGAGTSPAEPEFLCVVIQTTVQQLCNGWFSPNLTTKRNSVFRRWIRKDSFEEVHFRGHLPPKSEIESRSNRHLTQSRLQVTGCTAERYCLLHVVVQGPGSFRGPVNFFVRRTEVYSGDQPTAHWNRRMIPIFPCGGRQSIWVLPTAEFSCDLW